MDYLRRSRQPPSAATHKSRTGYIVTIGLVVTAALLIVQAVTQAIDFGAFNLRIRVLDSDNHGSVFGLASLLAQAAVGGASILRARRGAERRWAWLALGVLVVGLVLVRGLTAFNATALAAPLLVVFILLCWLTWCDVGVRGVVWTGLVLMMTSLVLHKVGLDADASTASDYTWAYQLEGIVKHGAELGGWMLILTGIIAGSDRVSSQTTADVVRPQELKSAVR